MSSGRLPTLNALRDRTDLVAPSADETSLAVVTASIWRARRRIFAWGLIGALVGGSFGLTRPHTYTAHASFTADDQQSTSAGAIAGQLGLSALLGGGTPSSQLYLDVVQSPVILLPVADSAYQVRTDSGIRRMTLMSLYAGKGKTPLERQANAFDHLRKEVKAELRTSGVVSLDVTTTDRSLSAQIAQRLLEQLNEFSQERRQQRASDERKFNEQRVVDAEAELRAAESRLETFMEQNRTYRTSPTLSVQGDRLQRDVEFRQSLYTSVAQAFEQARMDEARNTPTVSVVEPATLPMRQDPRWGGLKAGLLGLVVGISIALMLILLGDLFRRSRDAAAAMPPSVAGKLEGS